MKEDDEEAAHVIFVDYPPDKVEVAQTTEEHKSYHRKIDNKLYNLVVTIEIPGVKKFYIWTILDTGASTCCICQTVVPEEAQEDSKYLVQITGVNSRQIVNRKLKGGQLVIDKISSAFLSPIVPRLECGKEYKC